MLTWKEDFSSLDVIGVPGVISAATWMRESKDASRVTLIPCARSGGTSLRLHTEPTDTDIEWSGTMARCDIYRCHKGTADPEVYGNGSSFWFAHSIMLPDDFQAPSGTSYVLADFHNTGKSASASFHVNHVNTWNGNTENLGLLQLQRFIGSDPMNPSSHAVLLGPPQKNVWYDFLYHVRWSEKGDGYFDAWMNGRLVMQHEGPTLFPGQGVFWKCANYWTPNGKASSVIHDRIRLGTTRASVEW